MVWLFFDLKGHYSEQKALQSIDQLRIILNNHYKNYHSAWIALVLVRIFFVMFLS